MFISELQGVPAFIVTDSRMSLKMQETKNEEKKDIP